jgi:arginine N-succinyltransferase
MQVLRPIRESDLPGLVALARATGGGLTTLPPDEGFLADRIDDSLRAFRPRVRQPGGEYYLFVLEDAVAGEIVGVSGIASRVGGFDPWYSYAVRIERHAHAPLGISRDIPVLHLRTEHRGPSELCSLFLRPDYRRGGLGRLLSLGRLPFIGAHPHRFTDELIAELRGYIDQTGRSPFWEAVGRQFFEFDFYRADVLSGLREKQFIADLMPRHPIYVPLLPAEVQAVIGRVHHETEPALAMLLSQGFERVNEVDIFDAGPLLRARVAALRVLRQGRSLVVRASAAPAPREAPLWLLANSVIEYRACIAPATPGDDEVAVDPAVLAALQVEPGMNIRVAPVR